VFVLCKLGPQNIRGNNGLFFRELMIINAAHLLRDGDVVFCGNRATQPCLQSCQANARRPNLVMIYEARRGRRGSLRACRFPSATQPSFSGSLSVVSMYDIFANYLQRGNVDVGFMGGAQIDKYGNINATVVGGYDHPKCVCPAPAVRRRSRRGPMLLHHDAASKAPLP